MVFRYLMDDIMDDIRTLECIMQERCHETGIAPDAADFCHGTLREIKEFHKGIYAHSLRVGFYASHLAEEEDKSDSYVRLATLGGLLHDTGKIDFDEDLFTGRQITIEEYERLKHHVFAGADALRPNLLLTSIIAGRHHLKPNGKGYGIERDLPFRSNAMHKDMLAYCETLVGMCDWMDALFTRGGVRVGGMPIDRDDQRAVAALLSEEFHDYPDDAVALSRARWLYANRL